MKVESVTSIVNECAKQLGLVTASIDDPFASQDQNIVQMLSLLRSVGRRLVKEHDWSHLISEWELATVAETAGYNLPEGFGRLIDQTLWNDTQQMPVRGPLSAQEWQAIQVQTSAGIVSTQFRVAGNQLLLSPTPGTVVQTLTLNYFTSNWVSAAGGTAPINDFPSAADDLIWFDSELVIAALKLAFLRAKGFDSSAVQDDYENALASAKGADSPAPILSLNGRARDRLLDWCNVPRTGFGG